MLVVVKLVAAVAVMMFNGLVMCTDSDSDFAKESVGRSSADSPDSSCASARAHYYQHKLLATLQILQNKEETVRVQAESLAVAEARIATLTARAADLKRELERKGHEIQTLRLTVEENRLEKTDISVTAHIQEMENQENIVKTLQSNLSVIEDIYRECFYETVKQDNLIEMLRKSYLDVRLMDKQKTDHITKLNNVINIQKWSLDRCEDIAAEVDNLKMEISNFLNSSSNDSGMWEDSLAGAVGEDLQDIAGQLLRLRELLTGGCTCGLEQENIKLKQSSTDTEMEVTQLRQRISDLEDSIATKDMLDQRCRDEIDSKHSEGIRGQLLSMEQVSKEQNTNCDHLTRQLNQVQALLKDKTAELGKIQQQCEIYQETITRLTDSLEKTEQITKENASLRNENTEVSREAARLQRAAHTLEAALQRARAHADQIESCYRQKAGSTLELEAQLDEAHSRGAELCGEARRVVRAVVGWARDTRRRIRELEEQIQRKNAELRLLRQDGHPAQSDVISRITSNTDHYCSMYPSSSMTSSPVEERSRYPRPSTSEMRATCSDSMSPRNEGSRRSTSCTRERRGGAASTCANVTESPPPVPPKRILKKRNCGERINFNMLGEWWRGSEREASSQHPVRCDATTSRAMLTPRDDTRARRRNATRYSARDDEPTLHLPRDRDASRRLQDDKDTTFLLQRKDDAAHPLPHETEASCHLTADCDTTRQVARDDSDARHGCNTTRHCAHCVVTDTRDLGELLTVSGWPDERLVSRLQRMSASLADSMRRWKR